MTEGSEERLIEALAAYAHKAWSGWMVYMFGRSEDNRDGTMTIPQWAVERWRRQAETKYESLPETEKQSDRDEAKEMIAILRAIEPPSIWDNIKEGA